EDDKGCLVDMSARREILSEAKDVWITHIVTGRRTAHRISASMRVAATRDRKTEGDGIRCCDSLWVTMCVIHTKDDKGGQEDTWRCAFGPMMNFNGQNRLFCRGRFIAHIADLSAYEGHQRPIGR